VSLPTELTIASGGIWQVNIHKRGEESSVTDFDENDLDLEGPSFITKVKVRACRF
jgi:hypothetical protein